MPFELRRFTNLTQLSLGDIMLEIASECRNGCTDSHSTYQHFAKAKARHTTQLRPEDGLYKMHEVFDDDEREFLYTVVNSINFAGMREREDRWQALLNEYRSNP